MHNDTIKAPKFNQGFPYLVSEADKKALKELGIGVNLGPGVDKTP